MNKFYFELTDTFGSEANYSWVKRYVITAKSLRGALQKFSRETGLHLKHDYGNNSENMRYNVKHCCQCAFIDEIIDEDSYERLVKNYSRLIEL